MELSGKDERLSATKIRRVLAVLALLAVSGIVAIRPGVSHRNYESGTVTHEILSLEDAFGMKPQARVLDRLIDQVSRKIGDAPDAENTDIMDCMSILSRIDGVLRENGFEYRSSTLLSDSLEACGGHREDAFGGPTGLNPRASKDLVIEEGNEELLSNKQFHFVDCDILTYLYLAVGEAMNLPLRAVAAPKHLFVRWSFPDGTYINWETTTACPVSDAQYIKKLQINPRAVANGVYLRSLERSGILSYAYMSMGIRLAKTESDQQAFFCFDKAVSLCSRNAQAFYNRGVFYSMRGLEEKAEIDFQKAVALDPGYTSARFKRAVIFHKRGDLRNAIREYTGILTAGSDHHVALLNRAAAYHSLGDYGRSIRDYTAVVVSTGNPNAHNNRAKVYSETGEYEKAADDYNRALSLDCDDPDILNDVAWFLAGVPDPVFANPKKAVSLVKAALRKKAAAEYFDTLSVAYARRGDFEEAQYAEKVAISMTSEPYELTEFKARLDLYKQGKPYIWKARLEKTGTGME